MNILRKLFGGSSTLHASSDEPGRVSCEEVVDIICSKASNFTNGRGMVLILLEICEIQVYFFNGAPRVSWKYENHQFSTDRVGQTILEGPPLKFILRVNDESRLAKVIQKKFRQHDIGITPLWHLDRSASDYHIMEIMHRDDAGIRISFE